MKPIIFCDFDGTITNSDNIVQIMENFGPQEAEELKKKILGQQITIKEGVRQLFSLLSTEKKEEIISFVLENAEIRNGFSQFVSYTKEHQIPLYIVSGGIDFFLYPVLEPYGPFEKVYCNEADFSGDSIHIHYPHQCDEQCTSQGCGCCKPSVIRKQSNEESYNIVIGDSITDLEAAKMADAVLARDFLIKKCEEENIPFKPFNDFYDCIEYIEGLLVTKS
ncbi:2-hydroxy-3-keto-5-methylthiopentenyl-1-phosphate phosphatase [Cytobacillus purgationiresistens]|uniref:2-hydroxy-3-keto-5-methylthiopentenyl-1-phosphate phosphatase n=1 Tax=Cytobacillus purgationiresistens TaxID=863449 RepID=A0ABU0AND7_9BACI|nr:2-hydroxy-3-keto-5-methylthiopentenyl-1-phosphate phosphatase [Cytobacillus purgationiresistens]MDQ0272799.1 2-hydroxy-3-keto-5-methylthiopentenyl-1-phosphate phosphatase [Cytobacillus purgationiresistens]